MSRYHTMYYVWWYLENAGLVQDLISAVKEKGWRFNEKPLPGEITVAQALEEEYKAYKAVK